MGIISRGHSSDRKRSGTTVIASGTKLVGDLSLTDNLHIDGNVEGKIQCDAEVSIGEKGVCEGDIVAGKVMISGRFTGTVDAERLEIVASGNVSGTVSVGQLVVESGAQFNGTSKIKGQEPPRQLRHDKAASEQKDGGKKQDDSNLKEEKDAGTNRKVG